MPPDEQPNVFVTGSTDGIGLQTAHDLAKRGAGVVLHGRTETRVAAARAALEKSFPGAVRGHVLADFASLDGVRASVKALEHTGVPIHVLVNNAGIYMNERRLSPDGFEMTMAVNHFAPLLLTHLLLASPTGSALRRIVNVSSVAHTSGTIHMNDIAFVRRWFDGYGAYAASKLANVLTTVALAPRLSPRKATINALHPGVVSTKLLREGFGGMRGPDSLEAGAHTSVLLSLDAIGGEVTGSYFSQGKEAAMHEVATDDAIANELYEQSCFAVGIAPLPLPKR